MWRAICACAASPSRLMSAKRRTCFAINPACSSPPWREIFAADAERKQDFAEAQATYQAMVAVYSGLGYELVTLPLASVAERVRRSEEHTSELQSLMRNSYAVFCLQKKNQITTSQIYLL